MIDKLVILGNGVDWCYASLYGFQSDAKVSIINERFPIENLILNRIGRYYFSERLNRRINMPCKIIWYIPILNRIKREFDGHENVCLLIYDHNILGGQESFIRQFKKIFPKCKLAYIFTNIVEYSAAKEKSYLDKLDNWYDIVFAFDPIDAEKYGFSYSPLIYDVDLNHCKEKKENDETMVFYVGQAKDRLTMLLSCYEKLKELGIKCDFHIANVNDGDIRHADGIIYNKFMKYQECVDSIKKATCLIDIIQGDSSGLTIKTCEAVCYDKKLITTNKHVKEYPFYDERYISVIDGPEDIDINFFENNKDVHYSDEGKAFFSASSFLKKLDSLI